MIIKYKPANIHQVQLDHSYLCRFRVKSRVNIRQTHLPRQLAVIRIRAIDI